jgi:adenylate cyclase
LPPGAPELFPFRSGRQRYWANVRAFPLGSNRTEQIFVLVPERDLVGVVDRMRYLQLAIAVLGFAGALGLAVLLARRYSRPLAALVVNSERIGALDLSELAPVDTSLREVDQLASEQERMRVALDSFSRYVPMDVVRELMSRGEAARIGGTRRVVTVLFTDIRGFTTVAEGMEPEALTTHLAEYFEELLGIVQGDGYGTVTQLTGDGLVGFWGAPRPDEEHASHAATAVLACRERVEKLNESWRRAGKPELHTRFGLATGAAVVGNVGSASRLVYTAIGDTVNLASRLEGLGRFYGTSILASEETKTAAGGFEWRLVDRVRVKGKSRPVAVYELLAPAGRAPDRELAFARRYEQALELHHERRFAEARAVLEELEEQRAGDLSVERLLGLARAFESEPPGPGWDGVTDYFEK